MDNKYKDAELLYVYGNGRGFAGHEGFFFLKTGEYEGDEDLSHHGSPYYERFITGVEIPSMKERDCGSENYNWYYVDAHIKELEDRLKEIHRMSYI